MSDVTELPPLLDEDGTSLGDVPAWIGPRDLERWLVCALLAMQFTRQANGHPEMVMFATELFRSDMPLGDPAEVVEAVEGAGEGWRLEEARRPDVKLQWRNRLGRWVDMPDPPKAPPKRALRKPQSPGATPLYTIEEIEAAGLDKWPEKGEAAQRLLGDARNTAELYSTGQPASPGTMEVIPYTPERTALHDEIIAAFFEGKTPPEGSPLAIFMAGGPASGKSTLLGANPELLPAEENTIRVDPDVIKESLDEYMTLRAAKDRYAATAVHDESGDIAARLLLEAMERGFHVAIDGTGNSDPGDFTHQLERARENGYTVDVIYVNAPTDAAIAWAIHRADESGRFVPVSVIRDQHAKVSRNFVNEVVGIDWLNALDVYDRGDHIATWEDGTLKVIDKARFAAFVQKQDEVPARRRGPEDG